MDPTASGSPPSPTSSSSSNPAPSSDSPPSPSSSPPAPASTPTPTASSSPPPTTPSASPPSTGATETPPSPPPATPTTPAASPPAEKSPAPPPPPASSAAPSPPNTSPTPPVSTGAASSPPPPLSRALLAPPPPHATKSPSPPSATPSTPSSSTIIGVGIGVGLLAILMVAFLASCSTKKKKRKNDYFRDQSLGAQGGGGYYSGQQPHPNWNNPNMMNVPTPPGAMGPPGAWGAPPAMMSGEMMSGNYSSGPYGPPLPPPAPMGFNQSTFTYEELAAATGGFVQANLLGQGGFGYVHKGTLPNGKEIAVKSLKAGSGQGEREFQAEVEIISRVHHRHLVSLVGYCIADGQRMLVYEFVPNGTLEGHLHGNGPVMDWPARLRIALGSSKGLAYLHEDCHPRIIHRDIKGANILLDNNYEAMVADFGLAKLSTDNFTHVSTRVMGTFGYLAPEYASSGKLTDKSDVFSFGVMLLELVTGRRPVDTANTYMEDSLVDWARPLLQRALEDGNFEELVDPRLENNFNPNELACMAACAAAAVRHSAKRRPKMSQIARALEGDASLDDLNDALMRGGQSSNSLKGSSNGSSVDYDTGLYNADMKRFRQVVMSSKELNSGSD